MANLKTIRDRIKSVKNTKKITEAMRLVAAAKVRRAQEQVTATRPFAEIDWQRYCTVWRNACSLKIWICRCWKNAKCDLWDCW